jgi:hypothetical protein
MIDASPLEQISYFSRSLIRGPRWFVEAEIGRLLAVVRERNAYFGVTGSLLFSGGCFAQILEGPMHSVELIYRAIERDPRHTDVTLLFRKRVAERAFPDWSMRYIPEPESLWGKASAPGLFERLSDAVRSVEI